ncbi:MAG: hypothetical protein AAB513_00365 [Patescibacteria group bacterium]
MRPNTILEISKLPVVLITLGVLASGFVCTGMIVRVSMHNPADSMGTVTIISADNQGCCDTSISKHIESWKSVLLLVVPREIKDGLILLLLGLATAFAFASLRFGYDPDDHGRLSYRFYIRDNPELALFNQLGLAFARGILNPKIY